MIQIGSPFSPIFGATFINERHEEVEGSFRDLCNGEGITYTQISEDIRILENFPILKKILLNKFYEFIKTSNLNYNNKFGITTSWLTKSENRQQTMIHNHKNSLYSGVYYYGNKYYSNSGDLVFINPLTEISTIDIEPEGSTSNFETVFPKPKLLIFFPSYIKHQFQPNYSNISRYSLAFNIVPIGQYGVSDSSYDTSWFN